MNQQPLLQPGQPAPDFTLPAAPDRTITLSSLRGSPVVLIFYPADFSPVCGDELSVFTQAVPLFAAKNAQLLGISVDGVWAHQAFRNERHLGFDLLSDFQPKGAVSASYGAYDDTAGVSQRALFLIDGQGTIAWSQLSPMGTNPGADGVLNALDQLTSGGTR